MIDVLLQVACIACGFLTIGLVTAFVMIEWEKTR